MIGIVACGSRVTLKTAGPVCEDLSASPPSRALEIGGNPFVRLEQESSHWDIALRTG